MKIPLKQISIIIGILVFLIALVGGVIAVEDRYAKYTEFCQLETRLDRKIMRDDIRNYQLQLWDMERNYGRKEAMEKREYKEIKYKQKELQEKLEKN